MEQWKIHKDRGRCEKPGCSLAADREFYAVLQLPECVRYERCATCFEEMKRENEELPFHWKVRRTLDGKNKPVLDLESLRALFDRLGEAPEEPDAAAPEPETESHIETRPEEGERPATNPNDLRYLVALLLLRKRRLKMVDPQNEEQEAADLVVVDPKIEGMEPVALDAPELDPEQLGGLREELMAAIGEETETPAVTAENEAS